MRVQKGQSTEKHATDTYPDLEIIRNAEQIIMLKAQMQERVRSDSMYQSFVRNT